MPPETPWLSVAMPVHDGERWLAETLDSVTLQDCSGIELLVWDSSTTDECRKIVERYASAIQIRYVPTRTGSWTAKTNLAAAEARASHLSILHQDDLWLPGRVDAIRRAISEHSEAALILNPSYIVDERSRRRGLWRCPLPAGCKLSVEQLAEKLLIQNFVGIPAPVIARSAWSAVGGLDEALWYTADWDLYLKLGAYGPTWYVDEPTTAFRIHGTSLTVSGSKDRRSFREQMETVLDRHIGLAASSRRQEILRCARASIAVNCALAGAAGGKPRALFSALWQVAALGPSQIAEYLRSSRLAERALPRLRARLAGSF